MSQKVLSIIVPTYNMEKYLSYCMDSFLIEKNRDKLEVIIVNDGSKDKSLDIAKDYVLNYPDVFKLIDKKNGNYGSCINAALPVATGEYVKVIDADDSVDTQNLDEFISFLNEYDVDLVLSDFVLVDENRSEIQYISYNWGYTIMSMKEICVTERFKDMEMHAVTYRREMLMKSGYHQTEGVSYTDQQWIFSPMAYVKEVAVFNKPVYRYLVGRVGQTIDPKVKIKKMAERTTMVLDMIVQYENLSQNVCSEIKSYLDARIRPNVQDIYVTYFSNSSKIDKEIICQFDESYKDKAPISYKYMSCITWYIRIWRSLSTYFLLEKLFCRFFSILLKAKLLLK